MPTFARWVLLAALPIAVLAIDAQAARQTVCTITVNSPDERDVFRRNLPPDEYDFVELVEHGRPDWFAAACRSGVRCDLLIISGHFDGGDEFYSDRLGAREFLPVDEMERASCSASCPGLLSQLKEVYLFGCNTLNAEAMRSASAETARSLVRSGHSPADAERLSQVLNERHGESNRDRMRRIFNDVPVIYGFSSKAPLGTAAGPLLDRYFQSGTGGEIGTGRASAKLLSLFAPSSMTVGVGVKDSDPDSGFRRDVCHFSDDRLSPAQKLGFVHDLMGREMAEVRMFFDHLEKYSALLDERERQVPSVASALDAIARDGSARTRYLDFARDADQPAVRARMLDLARRLGWLSPADQRIELIRMIGEELAGDAVSSADVDLVCDLNKDGALGQERHRLHVSPAQANKVPHAAVLACLGSADGHARVLRALTSPNDDEVRIAQTYLRLRPIADVAEFRGLATGIARMNGSDAQVRALDTLAQNPLFDRDGLEELTHLFLRAKSVSVQRAIAGILIRSDYRAIARPELVRALRQHRLKSPDGEDLIDVLIRRLQSS
jgi:hypothetical protein